MSGAHSERLKAKLKAKIDPNHPVYIRLHRAISWIKAAEQLSKDKDLQIVNLWIALNACYAISGDRFNNSERTKLSEFLEKLIHVDKEQRIYDLFWFTYPGSVRILMGNKYVFRLFWENLRGEGEPWEPKFIQENEKVLQLLSQPGRSVELVNRVFNRLYEMRNQIVHGGATYASQTNRDQVRDSAAILFSFLPIVVDIMIDHPDEAWGEIHYPVVAD